MWPALIHPSCAWPNNRAPILSTWTMRRRPPPPILSARRRPAARCGPRRARPARRAGPCARPTTTARRRSALVTRHFRTDDVLDQPSHLGIEVLGHALLVAPDRLRELRRIPVANRFC